MSAAGRTFKSANSVVRQNLTWILARALDAVPPAAGALALTGVLAEYSSWKRARFPNAGRPLFTHREKLWEHVLPQVASRGPVTVLEFGVAWGYATQWWLSRLRDPGVEWHGFDVFTGLPTAWDRGGLTVFEAGTFSADGRTPAIDDARVRWHVGDVAASIHDIDWAAARTRPLFLLLDFDLYGPTSVALSAAAAALKPGDILYFDEAYDAWNERRAIDELRERFGLVCLGSTATALVLEVHDTPGSATG